MKIRRVHVLVATLVGLALAHLVTGFFAHNPRLHGEFMSGAQIRVIRRTHRAVQAYERTHGRRPERLEALVAEKLIDAKNLFDEQTREIPVIDAKTGRFSENPNVLYFPAVRKTDPPDLVLLCTPPSDRPGNEFHVIHSDGRYAEVTSRELIGLLQKTYTYLGR